MKQIDMPNTNPTELPQSIFGAMITIILGRITAITANDVAAFTTILAGTATFIFTVLKIVDWVEKRKIRQRYENRHKNKTP